MNFFTETNRRLNEEVQRLSAETGLSPDQLRKQACDLLNRARSQGHEAGPSLGARKRVIVTPHGHSLDAANVHTGEDS